LRSISFSARHCCPGQAQVRGAAVEHAPQQAGGVGQGVTEGGVADFMAMIIVA
jgi:hypothetical protein